MSGDREREAEREGAAPSWEVFLRPRRGLSHQHVGAVRASDADMALEHARDLYTRRGDPLSLWVVRSADVHAASPAERDPFFSNARHKPYRYPEYFAPMTGGDDKDDDGHDADD
ncbi:1,2-phenylacetyl-CoA epoxidase subunit PaaB [Streptomyces sp. Amel2xC10]|uniref:1,2-phenylacetyl-CoA epoxidase subunit PaaB n=1 Tax=Streptomyces sp. Amel2xC10 TaxID=1305826 RepID=UPI000A08B81E|nr:1,2-phenylacetyl-CoA epoxidase subunit PaaB [Streptomyces sp. Amel2xC10]SMF40799.1 ring-1,2-phenylacetyl-CoA epoxidase subunit PaaB [Streptomyces sp. Amel2xC10]